MPHPCENRDSVMRLLLAVYGTISALAYAALLPLWEGFDEPFHYAYVQTVSREGRAPVRKVDGISAEVRASLELAPASHVVQRNLPGVTTYAEWFRLPAEERARRRAALRSMAPELGDRIPRDGSNYEAQQAPLAYVLMAPLDRLWAGAPLPDRVWRIRAAVGAAAALAAAWGMLALGRQLGLPGAWAAWAAFLLLSSQMFYAASAHIGNDWLAIAMAPWFFAAAAAYAGRPDARRGAALGGLLAAGLLAKAYYLALLPLAVGLALWKRRGAAAVLAPLAVLAGPWYWRNWTLYGTVTGALESITDHGAADIAGALARMPWAAVLGSSARRSLWTGNNLFDSFSSATLNAMLALAAAGALLYLRTAWRKRPGAAEGVLLAGGVLFAGLLAYSTAALWLVFGDQAVGGAPWYTPVLFPAAYGLAAVGLARGGRAGWWIAAAMAAMWGYLMAATWWLKLIPLYGGYQGPVRPRALAEWYGGGMELLGDTALLAPWAVVGLAAAATLAAAVTGTMAVRGVSLSRAAPARPTGVPAGRA